MTEQDKAAERGFAEWLKSLAPSLTMNPVVLMRLAFHAGARWARKEPK